MNRYTIYCTPEQTKKAAEVGAPIKAYKPVVIESKAGGSFTTPTMETVTAEQMIGWLEEQGIYVHFCKPNQRPTLLSFVLYDINDLYRKVFDGGEYQSREKATLPAIDAALDYLISIKNN